MIALNLLLENFNFSSALPMAYIPGAAPFFEGRFSNSSYGKLNFDKLPIDIWYPADVSTNETSAIHDIKYLLNLVIETIDECDLKLPEDFSGFQNVTFPSNFTEFCGAIPEEVCEDITNKKSTIEGVDDLIEFIAETIEEYTPETFTDFQTLILPVNFTEFCEVIPEELCEQIVNEISSIEDLDELIDFVIETVEEFPDWTLPENCTLFDNLTMPSNITEFCGMVPEELCDLIQRPPVRNGTFPLIIYSHDDGTLGTESIKFLASLAAIGFIVVATNHVGDTGLDNIDVDELALFNRPRDISAVIDYMLTDSAFVESIDETSIGVMGRGHGGFTAYAMASGYKSFTGDARVGAILSISGLSTPLTDSEIESITIPLMVIGGTLDTQTPIEDNTARVWEQGNSKHAYRVDVEGAVHDSFTSICGLIKAVNGTANQLPDKSTNSAVGDVLLEIADLLFDRGEGVCANTAPDEVLDVDIVHSVSISYISAFFKVILEKDEKFKFFLTPIFARALPVTFEMQITTESPTPIPTAEFNTCEESCNRFGCNKPTCIGCSFCALPLITNLRPEPEKINNIAKSWSFSSIKI